VLGRGRGGFSTKLHLRADRRGADGRPAPRADRAAGAGGGQAPGARPASAAAGPGGRRQGLHGAAGPLLPAAAGVGAVTPRLRSEPRPGVRFDRAVATRYVKLGERYHATVNIAMILLWL
jgi:hypothetical protein